MVIISRKHDPKNINYNQLQGTGLLPVPGPVCTLDKCLPKPLPVPQTPVPKPARRLPPKPLIAVKPSKKSNKWVLNGVRYPDFNSLWVNIPRKSFTALKVNG